MTKSDNSEHTQFDIHAGGALPDWAIADLARSGIKPEAAHAAGIQGIAPGDYEKLLGFTLPGMPSGYVIPFLDPTTGKPLLGKDGRAFVRVRLEHPFRVGDSDAKYLTPKDAGNRAYIPKAAHEAAIQGAPILVTEGEKKALAATLNGIPTIGLVGVFGYSDGGTRDLLADLHPYIGAGRDVTFVLDNDAYANHDIALAAHRFSKCARLRGCTLKVLVLPPRFDPAPDSARVVKVGLDDLLVAEGPDSVRVLLETGAPVDGTVEEIYVNWLGQYVRACAAANVSPEVMANEVVRKGFYDKTTDAARRRILGDAASVLPELVLAIDTRVRERCATEFKDVPTPEHGGENLAAGRSVRVPGSVDLQRIDAIQEDIVWCRGAGTELCSRPYPSRLLELARPGGAGAVNGAAGGRPPGPTATEMCNAFLAQPRFTRTGVCLLRFYRGRWFHYDGRHYGAIQEGDVLGMVMQFLRQHPLFSDRATTKTQTDMMNQLRAHDAAGVPSHVELPVWLDAEEPKPARDLIVLGNKIVNIANMVRAFQGERVADDKIAIDLTPGLFTTIAVDYDFDPDAKCPKFEMYLKQILPDLEAREAVQMLMGLCLVPDTSYNAFFVLYGPGGTGKSTFLHVLLALVGKENVCHVPFTKFTDKFSVGMLTEHLVNLIGEGDTELPRDVGLGRVEGVLKDVTDGGILPVERKFREPGKARATARCVAATNSLPTFYDRSSAIWDRLRIIPFEVVMRGTDGENRNLRHEIVAEELPGIFNWAVQGLAKLRRMKRFPETARGRVLKSEHRANCDHEREFLTDNYVAAAAAAPIPRQTLYTEYRNWMSARNYHPVGEGKFAQHVQRVFPEVSVSRQRTADGAQPRCWTGICRQKGVEG